MPQETLKDCVSTVLSTENISEKTRTAGERRANDNGERMVIPMRAVYFLSTKPLHMVKSCRLDVKRIVCVRKLQGTSVLAREAGKDKIAY